MYAFTYHRPATARQAASLLAKKEDAKLLAGGHTLLPTMKQRLASPGALVDLGEQDPRIVVLVGDLSESTMVHFFAERFPDRFIQVGIAEQNMACVAAGLAAMGKIPSA